MKIRELQLENIGVFDDETIEFQKCPEGKAEIHIFTGENGSGKTTLLQVLASLYLLNSNEDNTTLTFNPKNNELIKKIRNGNSNSVTFVVEDEDFVKSYDFSISKISNSHYFLPFTQFRKDHITQKLRSFLNRQLKERTLRYLGGFSFAAFAYSGYRRVKDEKINLVNEVKNEPLYQALDFVKDENSNFTVNQWLGRNLSKRALAIEDKNNDSEKFAENVRNLEKIVGDVIGYEIRFKLTTDLLLVLIKDNQELDFDVLPDGLKSLISWIGDLLMRLDLLEWENDTPIFEREIILFLDEIEVHLHPAWQRKVLPVVQKLFKNSQIFVSTHSPFVVNSIDDAWVYELKVENGKAKVAEKSLTKTAYSYQTVLREIFDIDERFGEETQKELDNFYLKSKAVLESNGNGKVSKKKLLEAAKHLASQSAELQSLVFLELARLSNETGEAYEI